MTVLLVVDDAARRAEVKAILSSFAEVRVVRDVGDADAAVAAARSACPDVVVLDLHLDALAGRQVLTRLRAAAASSRIVVDSRSSEDPALPGQVAGDAATTEDVAYLVDLLTDLGRQRAKGAGVPSATGRADVGKARAFLAHQCQGWGCVEVLEDAQLVLSELVTNATVHAKAPCEVRARTAVGVLRLEVGDGGGGALDARAPEGLDDHGRGLLLVDALCSAWRVESGPGPGKVVSAELAPGRRRQREVVA